MHLFRLVINAMMAMFLLFSVLSVLAGSSRAREYKVAVFEHHPYFVSSLTPPSREEAVGIMRRNTVVYGEQARRARQQGAQIIVFPEDGIYGFFHTRDVMLPYLEPIPQVSNTKSIIPCTDPKPNSEILQELSCIARNNSIALVANMGDVQYCTHSDPNCPSDGRYQYNTDVVFDNDGRLLAKYHKQHLFFEKAFNTPTKCEFVTFVTSFQVRFGVFTCFDMLFKDPAIDLVEAYGVENIVFPTAWYHGFPSLISVEFQQAWSRANCVNLVAANQFFPSLGFTGSGVYACGEVKTYIYNVESIEKRLLFATLQSGNREPKTNYDIMLNQQDKLFHYIFKETELDIESKMNVVEGVENKQRMFDGQDLNGLDKNKQQYDSATTFKAEIMNNAFTLIKLSSSDSKASVCGEGLCCYLDYSLPKGNTFTETFVLGAFRGSNPNGFYWEVCLLLKCASSQDNSCGKVVEDSGTVFQSFTLEGNFSSTAMVFPTALGSNVTLFSPDQVKFGNNIISSEALEKPLLTAALVGRVFSKDKPKH